MGCPVGHPIFSLIRSVGLRSVNVPGENSPPAAFYGADAIANEWLEALEGREVIEQVAADLVEFFLRGDRVDTDRYPTSFASS